MQYEHLTGSEKAGILVLSLPEDLVREFLRDLDDREVERILSAVARFETIPSDIQRKVMDEFHSTIGQREVAPRGGRDQARQIAEAVLDSDRAQRVLERLGQEERHIAWTLRAFSPAYIAQVLSPEHPQTIALVLSQIPADRGATVIAELREEIRSDVVLALAHLESVTTDVIAQLEEGILHLFGKPPGAETRVGGADVAAKLLNSVAKTEGSAILDVLDERDPELAGLIRSRMLTFSDLIRIDARDFQSLLREVATEDLVIALKTASDEMKEKIFSNMSKRAAEQLREEIELSAPAKLSDVERVQREVVEVARRLEEEGKLSIPVGGADDVLV